MQALFDPERHERLADREQSEPRARDAMAALCHDAERAFDPEQLWRCTGR
jgi:hypothetical protein